MIIEEQLQYAVVEKISYSWPEMEELRKIIPLQCEIKGECKIEFLSHRFVLIRLTLMEDYIHLLSKPSFYLRAKDGYHQMRGLKWEPWFNPAIETSMAIA